MAVPIDPRYRGVPKYALRNVGQSMNRKCPDGGIWIFVRLEDLIGVGYQPGNYVIVERREDGDIEATVKQVRIGPDGKFWLYPDSTDPSFQPIAVTGTEETLVKVVGLAIGVYGGLL